MAGTQNPPAWSRFAVLALGATLLLVGGSAVLSSIYWLSELEGEDATMFVLQLIQSALVAGLGAVLIGTASSYSAGAPRFKPAVLLFSLVLLATAALGFYLNSEFEGSGYLTEAILLTLVGLGGLAAVMMSNPASPNRHNAPIVGAVSALLLFITYLVRDDAVNGFGAFFALLFGPSGFIPGLVGHGAEAVFKLLAILVASSMAVAWPKMQQGPGRALVVLLLGAAAVMLAIGLLIGAIDGFKLKPLDDLDGAPGLIVTAQVLFFLSLLTGLAAALLIAGAGLIPSLAALAHFTSPTPQAGAAGWSSASAPVAPAAPVWAAASPSPQSPPPAEAARQDYSFEGPAVVAPVPVMTRPTKQANPPRRATAATAPPAVAGARLLQCPKCGTQVPMTPGVKPVCPQCWFGA